MKKTEYVTVPKSRWKHLQHTKFFLENSGKFVLYTNGKDPLKEKLKRGSLTPDELFVHVDDKPEMFKTLHTEWNNEVKHNIKQGNVKAVKEKLIDIAEETVFSDPRGNQLPGCAETVYTMVDDMDGDLLKMIIMMGNKDYTTAAHSINVTALAINYTIFAGWSKDEIHEFSLCCFLHDVGKVDIPSQILKSPKRLTRSEFDIMKLHTTKGVRILKAHDFGSEKLNAAILECAHYHHEKLNGKGYHGLKGVELGRYIRTLAITDCYEALTSDDRPYRVRMHPRDTLELIRNEILTDEYDVEIWSEFVKSLGPK